MRFLSFRFLSAPRWSRVAAVLWVASATWAGAAEPLPPVDSMAARVQACTACHGPQGRATPDGYFPRLAGKPEGYLYQQLLNFRDGRRRYPQMANLLQHMTNDYLQAIAQHFARLEVPYPAPAPAVLSRAQLELGRRLVEQGDPARQLPACIQCHGQSLTGVAPAIPGLLGLPRDYLNSQLGAWKTRQRAAPAPDCMAEVASHLSADEVSAVSGWLASQPVPAGGHPQARLAQRLPLRCGAVGEGTP